MMKRILRDSKSTTLLFIEAYLNHLVWGDSSVVERLPFTLIIRGSIPDWANRKKKSRFTCHIAPHKSSVQSGMLFRVWMIHVVVVLHCASSVAGIPGSPKPCDHRKVSRNLACGRRVYRLQAVMTGDADGYTPDSCGPPNKFHTSSTEQKPLVHLHCIHNNTTSQEAWLYCAPLPQKKKRGRGLGATEHTTCTRRRPAMILSNAPMGNESPI